MFLKITLKSSNNNNNNNNSNNNNSNNNNNNNNNSNNNNININKTSSEKAAVVAQRGASGLRWKELGHEREADVGLLLPRHEFRRL